MPIVREHILFAKEHTLLAVARSPHIDLPVCVTEAVTSPSKRTYFYGKRELDIVFKLLATILLTKCLYLVLLDKVIISELIISTLIGFIVGSFYIANILKIKYKSYAHDIK